MVEWYLTDYKVQANIKAQKYIKHPGRKDYQRKSKQNITTKKLYKRDK